MSRKAMEKALEALEYRQTGDPDPHIPERQAIEALRDALAEAEAPKAEPVAWYRPSCEGYDSAFRDHRTVMACTGGDWSEWIPLYTHPPAREAELSDEEIIAIRDEHLPAQGETFDCVAFARAVLAARGKG